MLFVSQLVSRNIENKEMTQMTQITQMTQWPEWQDALKTIDRMV